MSLAGKTIIITGAAGTLGRATAAAFGGAGAKLVLLDIDAKGLEAAYGKEAADRLPVAADLADRGQLDAAVKAATAKFGRIDVLCNVAGGFRMGPHVHETPDEMWRLMLDLNAGSVLHAAQAVVPAMLAGGGGKIVNVAATAGLGGKGQMGAYSVSKAAVIRLTESMAAELRERGINVNCVMPSIIDTPPNRADMPDADYSKWVSPDALADVILFLASDAARAIHGAAIPVVGLS